jgi:fermentation-respiration switch protein FrsA (DUF1100 family)
VLLFDYRGYGGNPGRPSEQGLARDVRAALKGANIGVGSSLREACEDRVHGSFLSLSRFPGAAWCACP